MINGLRTAAYPAPNLARAKVWYAMVFERQPYFDEPFHVGFQVGGFELGLVPDRQPSPDGPMALWGVADIQQEVDRLTALGVTGIGPIQDVGGGIRCVEVPDPFGNRIGLIENPHFSTLEVQ